MEIKQSIKRMQEHGLNVVRTPFTASFGERKECECIINEAFVALDKSIKNFEFLPEYNQVVDWMTDTKGKGLFLQGDVGRGKSIIVTGFIPLLMLDSYKKVVKPCQAELIPERYKTLMRSWSICIDDLGTEPKVNDFGERYEGFPHIANAAEAKLKLMFISTNLSSEQLLDRYGERTMDRIRRLCKIVKFKGKSLRK